MVIIAYFLKPSQEGFRNSHKLHKMPSTADLTAKTPLKNEKDGKIDTSCINLAVLS